MEPKGPSPYRIHPFQIIRPTVFIPVILIMSILRTVHFPEIIQDYYLIVLEVH